MKRRFSPKFLAIAGLAAFWSFSPAQADDILWKATGSGAWITGANWEGGAIPGSGDVAQFSNVGLITIGVSLWHNNHPTKGEGHAAAIVALSSRLKDLTISGTSNTSSTFYLHGATLHGIADTIFVNESDYQFTFSPAAAGISRPMDIALRADENHVIQVRGSGDVILQSKIAGSQSQLSIRGTGSGRVILEATNSTYSGGTLLHTGTLILAANGAAGTGAITNQEGILEVRAGVSVANAVTLGSQTASYQRLYNASQNYSGFSATSDLGATNVTFSLLGGIASDSRTLSTRFEASSLAINDTLRRSDILQLSGTANDVFVLELKLPDGAVNADYFLAWLDGDQWVNATQGNSATGADAILGFAGSFDASGASATLDYLGSWGYDVGNQSVWAVLDHNSAFAAAIPEPTSYALLGLGGFVLLLRRRYAPRTV